MKKEYIIYKEANQYEYILALFFTFYINPTYFKYNYGSTCFFDSGIKINGKVVLLFIAAIFVFSLPMTTFYFKYAVDNETISINSDNPEYLLQTIDTTIKTKFNKSDKTLKTNTNGEKYIFIIIKMHMQSG